MKIPYYKLLIIVLLIVGCVPFTFSNLQSAKMIRKGKVEFTPSYSSSINTNNFGFQTAYGLNERKNFRLRLERIMIDFDDFKNDSSSFIDMSNFNFKANLTHLSFGLKYQLVKNKSAFYFPISFTIPDVNNEILTQLEPTYIHTFTLGKNLEFNPSLKTLIPIYPDPKGFALAFNLGLGISSNFAKWVIRPEVGYLLFSHGIYNMSLGLSIYP